MSILKRLENCTNPDGEFSKGRTEVLPFERKPELASGRAFLPRQQFTAGTIEKSVIIYLEMTHLDSVKVFAIYRIIFTNIALLLFAKYCL